MKTKIFLPSLAIFGLILIFLLVERLGHDGSQGKRLSEQAPTSPTKQMPSPTAAATSHAGKPPTLEDPPDETGFVWPNLEQANQYLNRLANVEFPAGTRYIEGAHFSVPPAAVPGFLDRLNRGLDRSNPEKWISCLVSRTNKNHLIYGKDYGFDPETHHYEMVPVRMLPHPQFDLYIDPKSGNCHFSMAKNYDP